MTTEAEVIDLPVEEVEEKPKPRRGRKPKSESPPVNTPENAEAAPEQPQIPNAVLVVKAQDENGNIAVDVQTIGNVQPTEVLTLLEIAGPSFRQKIGLPPR